MTTYSVPVTTDYNCKDYSPNCYTGSGASYVSCGQRGVTYWGPDNTRSINPNNGTFTWTFTGEQPRCYQDKDNCNVSFNLFTGGNASDNDVGPLRIYLNGNDIGTDIWHSKYQGHDLSIAVELANSGYLDDNGPNTLKFENRDTEVSMSIALLEILQVYGMCGLTCDNFPGSSDCSGCGAKTPPCQFYSYTGYTGLDSTKSIHPCNKSYGDRSFTKFHTSSPCTIPYNNSCTLTWQNPSTP